MTRAVAILAALTALTVTACTPAQQAALWADPDCNVREMLHLYNEAGTSPWSL